MHFRNPLNFSDFVSISNSKPDKPKWSTRQRFVGPATVVFRQSWEFALLELITVVQTCLLKSAETVFKRKTFETLFELCWGISEWLALFFAEVDHLWNGICQPSSSKWDGKGLGSVLIPHVFRIISLIGSYRLLIKLDSILHRVHNVAGNCFLPTSSHIALLCPRSQRFWDANSWSRKDHKQPIPLKELDLLKGTGRKTVEKLLWFILLHSEPRQSFSSDRRQDVWSSSGVVNGLPSDICHRQKCA